MRSVQQLYGRVRVRFWLPYAAALAAVLLGAHLAWLATPSSAGGVAGSSLATPAWMVVAPAAIIAIAALGLRNEALGRLRAGRALAWLAACMAGYQGLLTATPAATTPGPATWLIENLAMSGWMVVLAVSQGCALVVFELCTGTVRAGLRRFLLWALVVAVAATALGPEISGVVVLAWMASLAVVPLALWLAVPRFNGRPRNSAVRVAVGAVAPALTVLVCGVLAVAVSFGTAARGAEIDVLGMGFLLGLLGSAALFSSALGELNNAANRPHHSAMTVAVRIVLWAVYLMVVVQAGASAGAWWGGHVVDVAVATTFVGAAGLPLWHWVVARCEVLANPRRAAAAALVQAGGVQAGSVQAGGEQARSSPGRLAQQVLRQALNDPSLAVHPALPDGRFTTLDAGSATVPPEATLVDGPHGTRLAAVVLGKDSHGIRQAALLDSIIDVVRPLLERASLQAELRDQAAQLAAEKLRADNAALQERSRLERDLHDGVQGRILSLGLTLGMAQDRLPDGETQLLLADAVDSLASVLAELKGLANGKLPQTLSRDGLNSAVADFVGRVPVPVHVVLPELRLGPAVSAVAYFVIAESVTNAVKHARCSQVQVVGTFSEGVFTLIVRDDGCGGADPRAGYGLRGLGERVHAAGGRLIVSDASPGTLVEVSLPCG